MEFMHIVAKSQATREMKKLCSLMCCIALTIAISVSTHVDGYVIHRRRQFDGELRSQSVSLSHPTSTTRRKTVETTKLQDPVQLNGGRTVKLERFFLNAFLGVRLQILNILCRLHLSYQGMLFFQLQTSCTMWWLWSRLVTGLNSVV